MAGEALGTPRPLIQVIDVRSTEDLLLESPFAIFLSTRRRLIEVKQNGWKGFEHSGPFRIDLPSR